MENNKQNELQDILYTKKVLKQQILDSEMVQ